MQTSESGPARPLALSLGDLCIDGNGIEEQRGPCAYTCCPEVVEYLKCIHRRRLCARLVTVSPHQVSTALEGLLSFG